MGIVHGVLSFEDYLNSIDLTRINQSMEDGGFSQMTAFMDESIFHHEKENNITDNDLNKHHIPQFYKELIYPVLLIHPWVSRFLVVL